MFYDSLVIFYAFPQGYGLSSCDMIRVYLNTHVDGSYYGPLLKEVSNNSRCCRSGCLRSLSKHMLLTLMGPMARTTVWSSSLAGSILRLVITWPTLVALMYVLAGVTGGTGFQYDQFGDIVFEDVTPADTGQKVQSTEGKFLVFY